jgi:hypothetical protein
MKFEGAAETKEKSCTGHKVKESKSHRYSVEGGSPRGFNKTDPARILEFLTRTAPVRIQMKP